MTFLDRLPGEAKEVIDKALVKPHNPWGVLPQNNEKALSSFQEPEEETVASGAQTMISVGKETDVDDVKRRAALAESNKKELEEFRKALGDIL